MNVASTIVKKLCIQFLLLGLIVVVAGKTANADSITLASVGTAANPNQTNATGLPTIPIAPHPAWVPALPGTAWVSYGITGDPNAPGWFVVPNNSVISFFDVFNIPGTPTGGTLTVRADDSTAVWLNGQLVFAEAPPNSYPTCSSFPIGCLASTEVTLNLAPFLQPGINTLDFRVAQRANVSFGLNYGGTVNYTPIPEPASLILLGTGLATLAGIVRRRTSHDP